LAGSLTTIAGSGLGDDVDGVGTAASMLSPRTSAVDSIGNIFVGDYGMKIRKISSSGKLVAVTILANMMMIMLIL
jgi:hypothetical protein